LRIAPCALRAAASLAALLACAGVAGEPAAPIPWRVVAAYPHDAQAFTQGLLLHAGRLYESTGLEGRSGVRIVEPASGRVLREHRLAPELFGEGLARVGAHLFQLTWKAGRGFVYALEDLRLLGEFRYPGEGWGLAYDGRHLYMSDGSARLRIVEPEGFAVAATLDVHEAGVAVPRLNELEFAAGHLFANVWGSERIARIDPATGRVTGWLDLTGLRGPLGAGAGVLNGIAHDPDTGHLWVTGKLWPRIFVLEIDQQM